MWDLLMKNEPNLCQTDDSVASCLVLFVRLDGLNGKKQDILAKSLVNLFTKQ